MGKPERKAREKTCSSSSSYLLRCFGISRKIHSHKQMLDDSAGGQEKKKTRSRWFSRATAFRLKNCEITTTTICETKKQNLTIEDDKQNLFRVIRQVTDPKNITAVGQHETKEKNTSQQRDINPEPLTLSGYDMCCEQASVRVGKLEPTKPVGSGPKREKNSRVRKASRVDPVIGISIIMLTLVIMLMWGRLCAVLCTCTWCYFLPRLKRKRIGGGEAEGKDVLDLNSAAYKKKIVLDGFLVRQQRRVLM
ncbi:hypothetical protein BRARA_B03728 [Brassica rapa]|uniref:Uncharacterized protein n=1 Tax=Brassica campestris TaxID=3711 RepID=A0A398AGX9_BRACM|nr:hypothetical protein BRARA_B03728 [Brassica rapa]CAG7895979.1 unnamed protein product [Brassica rapa]